MPRIMDVGHEPAIAISEALEAFIGTRKGVISVDTSRIR